MKKIKYIDAAMEIVNFDFEDVLDISPDNIGDGGSFNNDGYTGDDAEGAEVSPWG